jgi:hypothetical protein
MIVDETVKVKFGLGPICVAAGSTAGFEKFNRDKVLWTVRNAIELREKRPRAEAARL